MERMGTLPLTDLPAYMDGTVVALDGGYGMQARLRSLGVVEGKRLRKLSDIGRRGPVVVLIERTQVAIGFGIARRVMVRADASAMHGRRHFRP
jgi:ferrous iron transport protein A